MRSLAELGYQPVTAAEIEFYLHGSIARDLSEFWSELKTECATDAIPIYKIEKEKGAEQHEVSLAPSNPEKTVRDLLALKQFIADLALEHALVADFSAKPLPDQPGSGLHIHIHLENAAGENVFYKSNDGMSDELKYALGGLLADMQYFMPVFAPTPESKKRFVAGSNAPLTVSWGANNRTTALRLPDSGDHHNKRIEHRVAGADADPKKVMDVILSSIAAGFTNRREPGPQIYGDAALESYGLPKLVA